MHLEQIETLFSNNLLKFIVLHTTLYLQYKIHIFQILHKMALNLLSLLHQSVARSFSIVDLDLKYCSYNYHWNKNLTKTVREIFNVPSEIFLM